MNSSCTWDEEIVSPLCFIHILSWIQDLSKELRDKLQDLNKELRDKLHDLKKELRDKLQDLNKELRDELQDSNIFENLNSVAHI